MREQYLWLAFIAALIIGVILLVTVGVDAAEDKCYVELEQDCVTVNGTEFRP